MMHPVVTEYIGKQFRLDWLGVHNKAHFQGVQENGLRLAEETQTDTTVMGLFDPIVIVADFWHGSVCQHLGQRHFATHQAPFCIRYQSTGFDHHPAVRILTAFGFKTVSMITVSISLK
jgi:hypothetical protein